MYHSPRSTRRITPRSSPELSPPADFLTGSPSRGSILTIQNDLLKHQGANINKLHHAVTTLSNAIFKHYSKIKPQYAELAKQSSRSFHIDFSTWLKDDFAKRSAAKKGSLPISVKALQELYQSNLLSCDMLFQELRKWSSIEKKEQNPIEFSDEPLALFEQYYIHPPSGRPGDSLDLLLNMDQLMLLIQQLTGDISFCQLTAQNFQN